MTADIRAAVARWARAKDNGIDGRGLWTAASPDQPWSIFPDRGGATCTIFRRGGHSWRVDTATALLWACVIECEAEPLDVGRCPACEKRSLPGRKLARHEWRYAFAEPGRGGAVEHCEGNVDYDADRWREDGWTVERVSDWAGRKRAEAFASRPCPACNGTGRETVEPARVVLDAAPRPYRREWSAEPYQRPDDVPPWAMVEVSNGRAVATWNEPPSLDGVGRLDVLTDRMQAHGELVGEWLALWLAGSEEWIEPAAAWLFERQIERTRERFMSDHATVYGADVVWQMLALALRHKPDYVGQRWHVDRGTTIEPHATGVGVSAVQYSPDELLHVHARLVAEVGGRTCTVTIRGRASLDEGVYGVPASLLAGAPIKVHVAMFDRSPELRAALGLEQRYWAEAIERPNLGPGGASDSASDRLHNAAATWPVYPVPLYPGDFDPAHREIVVPLYRPTGGSDLLTTTSAARAIDSLDQYVTFRIEHLRTPRPDGAIALAVRR